MTVLDECVLNALQNQIDDLNLVVAKLQIRMSKLEEVSLPKPCPFCGEIPKKFFDVRKNNYRIMCDINCKISPYATGQSYEEAIAVWNKRK